jgi:threonine/homoserine/homoserine lactone efflux protein
MIVEPAEVDADRSQPEERQRVTALRKDDAEIVESLQKTLRDGGGDGLHGWTLVNAKLSPVQLQLLSFVAVSALLIVAPGPDMALVARFALLGGRRAAFVASVGVGCGLMIWTLAASLGLAAVLRESEPAFVALKILGVTYLVFLGVQSLRGAWRPADVTVAPYARPRRAFRQGLFSNLGNPKIAVFFTSFLPQFTTAGASFGALLVLGLVFCLMTFCWLVGYGAVVAKAGDVLRRPRVKRVLEGLTGAVLIAFGVRLATEQR